MKRIVIIAQALVIAALVGVAIAGASGVTLEDLWGAIQRIDERTERIAAQLDEPTATATPEPTATPGPEQAIDWDLVPGDCDSLREKNARLWKRLADTEASMREAHGLPPDAVRAENRQASVRNTYYLWSCDYLRDLNEALRLEIGNFDRNGAERGDSTARARDRHAGAGVGV